MTGRRVLMAMSGGVDSSVAAALLLEQGFEVVGVTLRLWGGASDSGCCSVADVEDARFVAHQLGIDHHVFNLSAEFEATVVDPYVSDHAAGRTPNPCIECNRHLKFDLLLRRAEALGFDLVATGHHARRVTRPDGTHRVARGADPAKDQSYVLYPVTASALARVLLPVGDLTKEEVRERAEALGLRTADKPDSQDVCFITATDGGRLRFLGDRMPLTPGRVVDAAGAELARVPAVQLVTIGQRRGLGLPVPPGTSHRDPSERRYVVDVDVAAGVVTVGSHDELHRPSVRLGQVVWADVPVEGAVAAQVGAHGRPVAATVTLDEGAAQGVTQGVTQAVTQGVTVRWAEPQRRVAPGQSVVLYAGDEVVGGGIALAD